MCICTNIDAQKICVMPFFAINLINLIRKLNEIDWDFGYWYRSLEKYFFVVVVVVLLKKIKYNYRAL